MLEPDPFFELFPILFAGASLVILVVAALVVAIRRNRRKVKRSGHHTVALQPDVATQTPDSEPLRPAAPARTVKERLDELDAMRAAGTITDEEYAAAHADILRGI